MDMYQLFKIIMFNISMFPFKFSSTLWVENVSVAESDLEV